VRNCLSLLIFLISFSASAFAAEVRIVTLTPSIAEWSAEILGKDQALKVLVGVTEFSDYPAELKKIDRVGPYPQLNIEKIASLKPTLVIASSESTRTDQLEKLKRLHLPIEVMPAENFNSMEAWIKKLGQVLHEEKGGSAAAKKWSDGVTELKLILQKKKVQPRRMMIEVQDQPLMVVGGDSFLNPGFLLLGYRNIFADLKQSYPKVSREAVLKENPEVIFIMDFSGNPEDFKRAAEPWKKFAGLAATQKDQIRVISGDDYARCSLRLLNALKQLH
jgi:iron complex transport system substrate-binding protein